MRSSELLCRHIWKASKLSTQRSAQGRGAEAALHTASIRGIAFHTSPTRSSLTPFISSSKFRSSILPPHLSQSVSQSVFAASFRHLSTARSVNQEATTKPPAKAYKTEEDIEEDTERDNESSEFTKSERASQAAQINLSARLSKDDKSAQQRPGFGEVWRLIRIARPEAKTLAFAVALLLVSSSITMAVPFSIGKILDVATSAESGDEIFGLSPVTFYTALGSILAMGAAANFGRIITLRIVGERIVARLRSQLFRRTMIQDAEFFDANRVGDLISRLSSDTIIVGKSITQNLSDGLRSLVSGGAGLCLMAYTSLNLTGILALMFPPIGIGAFFYGRAIRNLSRKIQRNLGTLTKIAEERLGNVRTSQAFVGEVLEVARYNKQVKKIFSLGKREAWISATFFSASGMMGNMTILALLYVGGGLVKSGGISIGELTSFLMYTAYAGSSLFGLSSFYSELMKGVGAASRLFELQDRDPSISPTDGTPVKSARGPIKFENVTFSYPTRPAVTIFRDLNFEVAQGTNVAIVGPSGGGKSTIGSMLLRFYSPSEGRVLINGLDIATVNAKSLRRKIGFVGQEPVLFSGTIAENIAYGKPTATRAEINTAARKANCNFISDFPDGLDTNVGPRGTQLSGGQKQRIAIARALIKSPDILILDEATSALDAESETLVNSALASLLRGNNTTISIAHRLSTIKRSDQIVVLSNDGKVAEQGSYRELSSRPDGAFTKLMEWQMSGGEPTDLPKHRGLPTEQEELAAPLEQEDESDDAEEDEEELRQRKEQETKAEAVADKASNQST